MIQFDVRRFVNFDCLEQVSPSPDIVAFPIQITG